MLLLIWRNKKINLRELLPMNVRLNGKLITVEKPITLFDLVKSLDTKGPFAVEVNGTVIPKRQLEKTHINDKDLIEVITAVGGG